MTGQCATAWAYSPPNVAIRASKTTSASGWNYRTQSIAKSANALRAMGKEKCLAALREHSRSGDDDDQDVLEQVTLHCLCLFKNPSGKWDTPALGSPDSLFNPDVRKSIATFPLYVYEDVPFLINCGYRGTGQRFGCADKLLRQCESLEMIDHDIPLTGHVERATRFVESETFKEFYLSQNEIDYIAKMVLEQAVD